MLKLSRFPFSTTFIFLTFKWLSLSVADMSYFDFFRTKAFCAGYACVSGYSVVIEI